MGREGARTTEVASFEPAFDMMYERPRKTSGNAWSVLNREYHSCAHRELCEPRIRAKRAGRHNIRHEVANGRMGRCATLYLS